MNFLGVYPLFFIILIITFIWSFIHKTIFSILSPFIWSSIMLVLLTLYAQNMINYSPYNAAEDPYGPALIGLVLFPLMLLALIMGIVRIVKLFKKK